MVVNVNTQFLLANKLTPNQFILVQLVLEENSQTTARLLKLFPEMQNDLDTLVSIGALRQTERLNKYMVTDAYKSVLYGKDLFNELLSLFPSTVTRPDGKEEYLKTDLRRSRSRYKSITGEQVGIHDHIMECLQKEISIKTATGSMKYFRRLYNWLNAEGWKEYEKAKTAVGTVSTDGYGTDVF